MIQKALADASLPALAHEVERAGTPVVLTEGGREVAALVSMDDARWLEEAEDRWLCGLVDAARAEPGYDPADVMSAEEFFRSLDDERPTDAAE